MEQILKMYSKRLKLFYFYFSYRALKKIGVTYFLKALHAFLVV